MKERFKVITGAFLVLVKNNKIVLLRRRNTGFGDGLYSVPAGHVDAGESLGAAMIREAKEEVGIMVTAKDLELVHTMSVNASDGHRLHCFFKATTWEGELVNNEPEKCDDLAWFSIDQLPNDIVSYIPQAIECIQKGERYSEVGWS
jgi:ADP-ribose pyrophosphatase YjhB (NUDIX family)